MKLREEIGKTYLIAESIKSLIELYIEIDIRKIAETYLGKLRQLAEETDNLRIKHYFQISNALLLKTSQNKREITKSEALFEQLSIEDKVIPEVKIQALLHLCDLYLKDLNEIRDEIAYRCSLSFKCRHG